MILRYQAALLNVRRAARDFSESLLDAAKCAQELDPQGTALVDPLAEQVFREAAALLRASARIPGVHELFVAALTPKES